MDVKLDVKSLGIVVRIATFGGPITNVQYAIAPKFHPPALVDHYCTISRQCSARECLLEPYS